MQKATVMLNVKQIKIYIMDFLREHLQYYYLYHYSGLFMLIRIKNKYINYIF